VARCRTWPCRAARLGWRRSRPASPRLRGLRTDSSDAPVCSTAKPVDALALGWLYYDGAACAAARAPNAVPDPARPPSRRFPFDLPSTRCGSSPVGPAGGFVAKQEMLGPRPGALGRWSAYRAAGQLEYTPGPIQFHPRSGDTPAPRARSPSGRARGPTARERECGPPGVRETGRTVNQRPAVM